LDQASDLSGKVIVSCSLPLNAQKTELVLGHTTSGAEVLAKRVPGADVIAAFNNVPSEVLFGVLFIYQSAFWIALHFKESCNHYLNAALTELVTRR
jgi:hypothetical protein